MIVILESKIKPAQLKQLCDLYFKTFVKFVVDINFNYLSIGGELHADAEQKLLENGSSQDDLWGGNFYPWEPPEKRIEYTALINIRPRQDNMGMEIQDDKIRRKVKNLVEDMILAPDKELETKY